MYVQRNQGAICGAFANPQSGFAEEFLADDSAELQAFLSPQPTLQDIKSAQVSALRTSCQEAIYAGFDSCALGGPHHYPAKDTDQQNLASSVLSSLMPNLPADWTTPFWCADQGGIWVMRSHTAAQIQQVGVDGKAAIIAVIQLKALLEAALMAIDLQAPDAAERLEAIKWPG